MLWAIIFALSASSLVEAELRVMNEVVRCAVDDGYSGFQVESDSKMALALLSEDDARCWSDVIQETKLIAKRKGFCFGHVMRETNWVAHFLAMNHMGLRK
ncbi:unnamed protein product [Cuscuta europaea]|uniref:RNase H type-1 domain-containing protein n=1 Tax=Cuscuta europaea TaxID=41803 RepID=A0A9P1E7X2_CUSEU|nr:unnamed protein product [Cuscuta europaea]